MYKKSYKSPLGIIYMRSDGENLTGLWFESSRDVSKHSYNFEEKDLPIFDETSRWLDIYFSGKNPDFTPKYKIENLTPFRSQVIDIMNKIPYGKTVTYNDIAKESAVVFNPQLFITTLLKIRQNAPLKNKVSPKIKVNSKFPSNK